jgi:serine protease
VSSLSGSSQGWRLYKLTVPSGQSQLKITMSGGTGDADLYVRRGAAPTLSLWDYRPWLGGNNEVVTISNPAAADWYIGIFAYAAYSGVALNASYSAAAACTSYSGSLPGSGYAYYLPSSSGYSSAVSGSHTGKLTATGYDFDLYLQKYVNSTWTTVSLSNSSSSTENITYTGTSGTYRWRVYSYSGSGTFTLCVTKP